MSETVEEIKTKRCTTCQVTKILQEFSLNKKGYLGRQAVCKSCVSVLDKNRYVQRRQTNICACGNVITEDTASCIFCLEKDRHVTQDKKKEKICIYCDNPAVNDTTKCRNCLTRQKWQKVKSTYGLHQEDWNLLLAQQNYCCALCLVSFNSTDKICVDHCHMTKKVRGLVHGKCNSGLGLAKESIKTLRNWISYLQKHSTLQ